MSDRPVEMCGVACQGRWQLPPIVDAAEATRPCRDFAEQVFIRGGYWVAYGVRIPQGSCTCLSHREIARQGVPGARNGARSPTEPSRAQPISISRKPLKTVPHVVQRVL